MELVNLENICKIYNEGKYNQVVALSDVNLTIEQGERLAIVGVSGSGKTTLLNILGCIDKKTSGKFEFLKTDTQNFSQTDFAKLRKNSIGYVLQGFGLLEDFSVKDNVAIPLILCGDFKMDKIGQKVASVLKCVAMSEFSTKKVKFLSGGQKQRVAIARALVSEPKLVLADEPTSALDSVTAKDIMHYLIDYSKETNATLIVVTHDLSIAKMMDRTVSVFDGKIVEN